MEQGSICHCQYIIFFVNFPVLGRSWMHSRMRKKNMLILLNRVYVFAIKNTSQYTTEEKLKQMWVLEPQAFEFAQKCYFKHSICWSTIFFFLWNNAFLASLKGFNMLQGYPERKKGKGQPIHLCSAGWISVYVFLKHKNSY